MNASLVSAGVAPGHALSSPALVVPFGLVVLSLLAADLGLFQRSSRDPTTKEALAWSGLWIGLACLFGLIVFATRGPERGAEFFTGYLVEQALSIDNLFVFLLIFTELKVPVHARRRVLVWGILGAIVLRAGLIGAGTLVVGRFHFLTYGLGAFLVYAAMKLLTELRRDGDSEPSNGFAPSRWLARVVPVTDGFRGLHYFVREARGWSATPLFVAVVTIGFADAIFALDSIPAVFGVTTDPFIVLTSNLFAVLGLRSLFFVLAGLLDRLAYLKHGLVAVLLVVGLKMLVAWAWAPPAWVTLALVAVTIGAAVVASLLRKERKGHHAVGS
jgi:tellurite resistance protein TerC